MVWKRTSNSNHQAKRFRSLTLNLRHRHTWIIGEKIGREEETKKERRGRVREIMNRGYNGQTKTTFGIGRGVGTRSSGPVVFQVSP